MNQNKANNFTTKEKEKIQWCQKHLQGLIYAIQCLESKESNCVVHNKCNMYQELKKHIVTCSFKDKKCKYKLCYVGKILFMHFSMHNNCEEKTLCELCNEIDVIKPLKLIEKTEEEEVIEEIRLILSRIRHAKNCLERYHEKCSDLFCEKYIDILKHLMNCKSECNENDENCKKYIKYKFIYCHNLICKDVQCKICYNNSNHDNQPIAGPSNCNYNNDQCNTIQHFAIEPSDYELSSQNLDDLRSLIYLSDTNPNVIESDTVTTSTSKEISVFIDLSVGIKKIGIQEEINTNIMPISEQINQQDQQIGSYEPDTSNQNTNIIDLKAQSTSENAQTTSNWQQEIVTNFTEFLCKKIHVPTDVTQSQTSFLSENIRNLDLMDLDTVENNLITGSDSWEYVDEDLSDTNPNVTQSDIVTISTNEEEIIANEFTAINQQNPQIELCEPYTATLHSKSNDNNGQSTSNMQHEIYEISSQIHAPRDVTQYQTSCLSENIPSCLSEILTESRSENLKNDELKQALMPTLEKLIQQDPESLPFRTPVDPITLGIPDYFEIVKKPMDLDTVKINLITGKYSDPWEYIDDIWLMFENAWLYNRKTSRVYRYSTKLAEVFEQEINPVMKSFGYCCGNKYTYNAYCTDCACIIRKGIQFYCSYDKRLILCQTCYKKENSIVRINRDVQSDNFIPNDQFEEMKNDDLELEPFVDCNECGRKQHQICVLHLENIWPGGFVCDNCMKKKGTKRKENKFSAKRLPTTKLGIYIETRVNNFLKKKEAGAGEVHIRVVSSSDKIVEVKPGMRRRFVESNELCGEFPYRAKALFAFEEVDGVDVCFFGMHVQEYGSECPTPNTRRVYIAYLDSVHFFKPRQYRTAVYHEILLGYMDYVKQLGFTMAHIWACPPSEGDDYIFHCHPPDQKIPKAKRLQEWYKKMLDKGMIERTIQDYKDILKQAMEDKLNSAAELPYFERDFWPNVLEESIKELDQEEEEKRKQAEAAEAAANAMFSVTDNDEASGDGKKKGQKKAKKSNKSKAAQRKNNKKSNEQQNGNDLTAKIFATMEKHKEVFFVIRLHSAQSAASLAPIQDPDPLMNCDLMDGRDAFLTMARDKHYEFSSLRRAQFSTLNMLYELHNQGQDKYMYTCNNCKIAIESRYHCTVCDDFDLCLECKDHVGHPHKMEILYFDLDHSSAPDQLKETNPQEERKKCFQRCIQLLENASKCRDANCRLPSCQKMKCFIEHTQNCTKKAINGCPKCKNIIALCRGHAKYCKIENCFVLFCTKIKNITKELKQNHRQQDQRRFESMRYNQSFNKDVQINSLITQNQVNPVFPDNTVNQESEVNLFDLIEQYNSKN